MTKTAKAINAERAHATTQLHANRNALNDQRAAILKNNNALRKNSGFVAGIRKGVGQWATSMIGITVAIGAVTKIVGSAVKIFKDFQEANSKLEAVTRASTAEMGLMKDQAKALGSVTAFTASEVTALQIEFAKLGFPTGDIIQMTEATLAGAAALGSDLGEQAALTGALLKQFGLDAKEAGRVNDVLAESAASSALDFSKLSTALPIVGATANAVGISLERTTSLLGTLSDRGLDASTSGTALRNVFLELSKQGLTYEEAMAKINGSTDKAKTSMELFGKRGATAGLILAETGTQVNALEKALINADGAAQDMADTMLDNLSGDITIANSAWEGFILSLEDGTGVVAESSRSVIQRFTGILGSLTNLSSAAFTTGDAFKTFGNFLIDSLATFSPLAIVFKGITEAMDGVFGTEFTKKIDGAIPKFELVGDKVNKLNEGYDQLNEASLRYGELKIVDSFIKAGLGAEEAQKQFEKLVETQRTLNEGGGADGGGDTTNDDAVKDAAAERDVQRQANKNEKIKADKIKAETDLNNELKAIAIRTTEDDRTREEEEIREAFRLKKEAIEGNSELEKEVRFRLGEEMHEALNAQATVFREEDQIAEQERLTLKRELELETELIEAEGDFARLNEILEKKRVLELSNETLTTEQRILINAKYSAEAQKNEKAITEFKKDNAREIAQSAANLAGALSSLAKEGSDEAKAFAIVQAGINGALAITQALAQLGPIAGAIAAVGIGITTGVQIAKISSAKFADGGVLNGDSHANGGIPFTIDGRSGFEAEGGEAIMTKRAVQMFGSELSAMNQAGGGVAFAKGGIARKFASGGSVPSSSGVTASQQRTSIDSGMGEFSDRIIEGINDKEIINVATNTSDVASDVINIQSQAEF